jgi:Glyoxalase-like domain
VARLVELGARQINIGQRPDEGHVVLADPEGNESCVVLIDASMSRPVGPVCGVGRC